MKLLRTSAAAFQKQFRCLLEDRANPASPAMEATVKGILKRVRQQGDRALRIFTQKFDGHSPRSLEVSKAEIRAAYKKIKAGELASLKRAAERIKKFHQIQKKRLSGSWQVKSGGGLLGEKIQALSRVGIYVPGGLAAYPSSVLMNAIPARVAGVGEIIMVSPWPLGKVNPYTLVAADMAGVDRIFKVGGAQAIAALAYGTESIPAVDKITGPGNAYVATAKKLVFGRVGIDMIAGPTEIVIVADESAQPEWVASDLLSQAEHDPRAVAILLTPSLNLSREVLKAIENQLKKLSRREILEKALKTSRILLTTNIEEALKLVNVIAPEHLSLQIKGARGAVSRIQNAGAIFVGPHAPVAFGDYMAGPNHVLPTSGTARFSSPLGVSDFLKRSSVIDISPSLIKKLGPDVMRLAQVEGLTAHAASVKIRIPSPLAGEG